MTTKAEIIATLHLYEDSSATEWGDALAFEAINGELARLNTAATNSAIGFRLSIAGLERDPIDIPGALYDLGGSAKLEEQRGSPAGPANTALAALLSFASETQLAPDVAAGIGAVDVAGAGAPQTGADITAGAGLVEVVGVAAIVEGADVVVGEGTVV